MRTIFHRLVGCAWAVLALLNGPAAAMPSSTSSTMTVVIEGMAYRPERIEVKPGDTVVWVNKDVVPHTVTQVERKFDSKEISPGRKWSRRVDSTGEVDYFCAYHPMMKGKIIIKK